MLDWKLVGVPASKIRLREKPVDDATKAWTLEPTIVLETVTEGAAAEDMAAGLAIEAADENPAGVPPSEIPIPGPEIGGLGVGVITGEISGLRSSSNVLSRPNAFGPKVVNRMI